MKTLMITGAGGFFGSAVVKQLSQSEKYRIIAVTSGRKANDFPANVQADSADLLSAGEALLARHKPDILLHLAWGRQDGQARNSAANIEWLEASLKLLRAFIENGGKRFVFAGTSSEYEDDDGLRRESAGKVQMSMYGETKRAFAEVAKNYCQRVGVEFVDVRLFTLYGENDRHELGAIPLCIRTLMKDEAFVCKAPNTIRDYVYVGDAARAMEAILDSDYIGSVNVSSGQPRSMRDVFSCIADALGKKDLLRFENETVCGLILSGDNALLRDRIGFSQFTLFEEGIKKTVEWWREQP